MTDEQDIRRRFRLLNPALNERTRRLWAAAEARSLGRGGVSSVARATGVSRRAIAAGLLELEDRRALANGRIRREGGGRKRLTHADPRLVDSLDRLVEPTTRGDPMSPLRWTCKSVRNLAGELTRRGHPVSYRTVAAILHDMGYSLQSNRKSTEGSDHPDRDRQFRHIARRVREEQSAGNPVISVDTKKKEPVGNFKNSGREWRPKGRPAQVRVHDFVIKELGKVAPYGVYDLAANRGWVNVGIDHDTAEFAVESIRWWWRTAGRRSYPKARRVLITADGGGSNGYRVRLWKRELQKLADETGLEVCVCHLPTGTSKWNKIEHRLFSFITKNWRGQPLLSHAAIVNLIASTRTAAGLRVTCRLDMRSYPSGVKVSDEEMAALQITPASFHGEWNYTIHPRRKTPRH
ncbi:MAG: ISAzo13 family transposase [Tepidisphaerales bacterium]